jgi:hypothetical protein
VTEQASLREQIIRPGVEVIHASIPYEGVRHLLNDAKNIQRHMNRELEDIETDEDLNPEAKRRRAQEVEDKITERRCIGVTAHVQSGVS